MQRHNIRCLRRHQQWLTVHVGVLHSYMYSKLYDPNSKIIARTTVRISEPNPSPEDSLTRSKTQDRMLKSAENFMAGFFGLEWYVVNSADRAELDD